MQAAIRAIFDRGETVVPTKGDNRELRGVMLRLANPRARLSRSASRGKVFSALAEFVWYMSGSNRTEQIGHYLPRYWQSDEGGIVFGGYGPRLVGGSNQLETVIALLRRNPATRRAVMQIFDSADLLEQHADVPCTCTIQLLLRDGRLDVIVFIGSNDVFIGLPHDVFCFTMIQELVATEIGAEVGEYVHVAGSLHLYDRDAENAGRFLDEGYYSVRAMPTMPGSHCKANVDRLVAFEQELRTGSDPLSASLPDLPYWADLARLLIIFELSRSGRTSDIDQVVRQMSSDVYELHIADRIDRDGRA